MDRIYNFASGPACLPESALRKAADEMTNYRGTGMSVMEMSHRSKPFAEIIDNCESLLREIMSIPSNYKVLFLQGGASMQFSMVPLNLMNKNNKADFVITGSWAKKAYEEASRYGKANVIASSADRKFTYIPKLDPSLFDKDADYFNICYNNTIFGTHFSCVPDTGNVPLVADMSSCILSEPIDVSKFGMIYAGAQKNMGPSGLTTVIIREDLIGNHMPFTPIMLQYKTHSDDGSMYNTPPTYSIYICKLVLEWLKEMGGIKEIYKINLRKASLLYEFLDESDIFIPNIQGADRSIMNVTFVTGNPSLDDEFVLAATKAGFDGLKGHRSVGGMRASIYNAMPEEGVKSLVAFMKEFEMNKKKG